MEEKCSLSAIQCVEEEEEEEEFLTYIKKAVKA